MVDADTAQRTIGTDMLTAAVERRFLDRLHIGTVFLKDLVPSGITHLVVLFDLFYQAVDIDPGLLGQLFDRIRLCGRLVSFLDIPVPLLVEMIIQIMRMHMGYQIRTFLFILLQQLAVEDGKGDLARLCGDRIAGKGRIADLVFRHEPLAVAVDPQARLTESTVQNKVVHVVRQLIHQLHGAGFMACAGFPAHLDAVALHARNCEVEDRLAEFVSGLFLDHLRILTEAAGGDDHGCGPDFDFFAVLIHSDDADSLAVFHDDLLARCLKHKFHAEFFGALCHLFGHGSRSTRSRDPAVFRTDDMPGELTVRIRPGCFRCAERSLDTDEFHTHIHQPVDRIAGFEIIIPDRSGIYAIVCEIHMFPESLTRRQLHHLHSLDTGTDTQRAHAHVSSTAGCGALLQCNDTGTILGGCNTGGQAGQTGCHDDNISFQFLHVVLPPLKRRNPDSSGLRRVP